MLYAFLAERLMSCIDQARQAVFGKMDGPASDLSEPLVTKIERISKAGTSNGLIRYREFLVFRQRCK